MNVEGSLDKAYEYSCQAAYDQAVAEYDAVLARDPSSAFARYQRGYCHAARRDFQHALADFLQAMRLDSGLLGEYRGFLVKVLREVELDAGAEHQLRAHGFGATIHLIRAERYRATSRFVEAIQSLTDALGCCATAVDVEKGHLLYLRGYCQFKTGDFASAVADYDAALAVGYTGYGNCVASQRALAVQKQQKK
jgi:tetratricopeptide (TPR) repeat protein